MAKLLGGKIVLKCLHEFFKIKSNLWGVIVVMIREIFILFKSGEIIRLNNICMEYTL